MRGDSLEAMLSAYKDELTQVTYTPAYADFKRQYKKSAVRTKSRKKLNDDALMKKLEGLTAPEEEAPAKKAGARRK